MSTFTHTQGSEGLMIIFDMASAVQKYEQICASDLAGDNVTTQSTFPRTLPHVAGSSKDPEKGDVLSPLSPSLVSDL